MILGTNEKGEGVLTLSKNEYDRLKDGKPIVKNSAYAKGKFRITVTYKEWPRGWVFVPEGQAGRESNLIGHIPPEDAPNAEIAVAKFGSGCGDHFDCYFRDANGQWHSTGAEDTPEDFD